MAPKKFINPIKTNINRTTRRGLTTSTNTSNPFNKSTTSRKHTATETITNRNIIQKTTTQRNPNAEHIPSINKLLKTSFKANHVFTGPEIDAISRILIATNMSGMRFSREGKAIEHFKNLERKRLENVLTKDGTIGVIEKVVFNDPELTPSGAVYSARHLININPNLNYMLKLDALSAPERTQIQKFIFDTVISHLNKSGKLPQKILKETKTNIRLDPKVEKNVRFRLAELLKMFSNQKK